MKQIFIGKDKFKINKGKAKVVFMTPKSPSFRFGFYNCWKELGSLVDEEDKDFFFRYELGLGFISILWG